MQAARANLAQGEAELDDAQAALKRAQDLARQNFISGSALDTAEARYNKARAQIDTLKAQIAVAEANLRVAGVSFDQTLIRAPFSRHRADQERQRGRHRHAVFVGRRARPARWSRWPTWKRSRSRPMSPSPRSPRSRSAQPAEIQLDAFPELRLLGEVSRVVPTVDRSKATLLVKVKFVERDARVLPDMSAKIAFLSRALTPEERKPVPALRADAIVKRDGAEVVFVVDASDTVKPVPVKAGEKVGDLVRVEGVAPGTKVVANPPERLAAGCARRGGRRNSHAAAEAATDRHALVEIEHLSKAYVRGEQVVPVLTDINLVIREGDFVAMMGPSGSGKSTLLNLVAGIDKPDAGRLGVAGEDITQFGDTELADWRARTVGFIFQFYNLMPVLTAFENVELPLQLTTLSRAERRERVELLLGNGRARPTA